MKPILIVLALIAAHLAQAVETNRLTRGGSDVMMRVMEAGPLQHPLFLASENGQTPVLIMEPLQSLSFRELFPKWTVYRLVSSRDVMHRAQFSALLVDTNGTPSHLQTDDEVADFLRKTTKPLKNRDDALGLVRAFADLRSYRIVETPPDFPDARKRENQPAPADTDYKFVAEERKDHWRVYATFFTSDYSDAYERYVFSISPGGGVTLSKPVVIRFRTYVL